MRVLFGLLIPHGIPQTEAAAWVPFITTLVFVVVPAVLVRGSDVLKRRRKGQGWNEAIAAGTKLLTGSVWLDGLTLLAVALATFGVVWLILSLV